MPELPEVETVRRGLEKLILGKKISSVEIRYPKMIKTDLDEFQKEVPGQVVESTGRRGKYLLFYLTDKILISHLRMEGKYFYYPDQVPERKHAHVFFQFEDGGTLVYEDVRKFGTMELLFMRMSVSLGLWNCLLLTFWKPTLFLKILDQNLLNRILT